jgi:hypothetical protein
MTHQKSKSQNPPISDAVDIPVTRTSDNHDNAWIHDDSFAAITQRNRMWGMALSTANWSLLFEVTTLHVGTSLSLGMSMLRTRWPCQVARARLLQDQGYWHQGPSQALGKARSRCLHFRHCCQDLSVFNIVSIHSNTLEIMHPLYVRLIGLCRHNRVFVIRF